MPPVTQVLILANAIVFVLEAFAGQDLLATFALWPPGSGFAVHQILTYGFLHAGLAHIGFNMFAVYMFGGELERLWGGRFFLLYFLVCIVSAGLVQIVAGMLSGSPNPTVGASGGVFGLLLAFAMHFPRRTLVLLFPPIPMPAWLFVTLYGAIELVLGVTGTVAGVAHFAHLGGMLGGWLLLRRRFRRRW